MGVKTDELRLKRLLKTLLEFLWISCTFLNMKRDMAASEVKRAAMRIIIMPTGMLPFRAVKAEIHPLNTGKSSINPQLKKHSAMTHTIQPKTIVFSVAFFPNFSPGTPSSDANTLEDVDTELTDVHEEENEKSEGAVNPAEREKHRILKDKRREL